jgi:hypothetical protein
MAQLMLINPRKRKAHRKSARSPAQRAATKRMLAANRSRTRVSSNPIKRRRRSALKAVRHHSHRRVRRNPTAVRSYSGNLGSMVKCAGIGAVGAIAVDTLYNYLPLPVTMKTGLVGTASKAALAVAVGVLGKKFMGRTAGEMAQGSLTVIAYDLIKSYMPVTLPAVAGMGYLAPGINGGYLPQQGMGEYMANGGNFNFMTDHSTMGEYVNGY